MFTFGLLVVVRVLIKRNSLHPCHVMCTGSVLLALWLTTTFSSGKWRDGNSCSVSLRDRFSWTQTQRDKVPCPSMWRTSADSQWKIGWLTCRIHAEAWHSNRDDVWMCLTIVQKRNPQKQISFAAFLCSQWVLQLKIGVLNAKSHGCFFAMKNKIIILHVTCTDDVSAFAKHGSCANEICGVEHFGGRFNVQCLSWSVWWTVEAFPKEKQMSPPNRKVQWSWRLHICQFQSKKVTWQLGMDIAGGTEWQSVTHFEGVVPTETDDGAAMDTIWKKYGRSIVCI